MTGRSLRRCALTASVTGVSAMPQASLASVLPVAGATISASSSFFGPIGSTCAIASHTSWPQIDSRRLRKCAAVPKRVSVEALAGDRIGIISGYCALSASRAVRTGSKVQKDPHMAKPSVMFSINASFSGHGVRVRRICSFKSFAADAGATRPGRPGAVR